MRRNKEVDGSKIERRAAKKCAASRKVLREEEFGFGGFEGSWTERVRNIDSRTRYRIVSLFSRCSNTGGRSWLKWDGHHALAASAGGVGVVGQEAGREVRPRPRRGRLGAA
jgi:hypothetical protein